MGMKEFITDFKDMVKTKNMSTVNQKYLKPALEKTKELAVTTKDMVVQYTPIVVEASKKGWDKAYAVFQKKTSKTGASSTTQGTEPTTGGTTTQAQNTDIQNKSNKE